MDSSEYILLFLKRNSIHIRNNDAYSELNFKYYGFLLVTGIVKDISMLAQILL